MASAGKESERDPAVADVDGYSAWSSFEVRRVRDGRLYDAEADALAEEVPVALEYNGISHATMLATPTHLDDFARGFSLTEGIIDTLADIRGIDVEPRDNGIVVQLEIATSCEVRLKERRRNLAGRTGCGLCGVEELSQVSRPLTPLSAPMRVSLAVLERAQLQMRAGQTLHDATGATHAAALVDHEGNVLCVREDVGRHNALDKLIGATAKAGIPAAAMALVSSRASFEMVQKTIAAGIGVLAAVSAPTALAVRTARNNRLVLIGFHRGSKATVYAGAESINRRPCSTP